MILETEDVEGLNAMKLIKAIEEVVGPGKWFALRPRPNKQYEATFGSTDCCDILEEGFLFEGVRVGVKRPGAK